jgi:hypothetical protein
VWLAMIIIRPPKTAMLFFAESLRRLQTQSSFSSLWSLVLRLRSYAFGLVSFVFHSSTRLRVYSSTRRSLGEDGPFSLDFCPISGKSPCSIPLEDFVCNCDISISKE